MISGRLWALVAVAVLLAAALIVFALFPPKPLPDKLALDPFVYVERLSVEHALIGWTEDDQAPALVALVNTQHTANGTPLARIIHV